MNVYSDLLKKHIVRAIKLPWACWKNSGVIIHTFIALGEHMEKREREKKTFILCQVFTIKVTITLLLILYSQGTKD